MNRREEILSLVQERGVASVKELSIALGCSEPTIRRDLRRLAHSGLVIRTYGGALALEGPSRSASRPPAPSGQRPGDVREQIGRAAAALMREGDTVVIGAGETALEVARAVRQRENLTVITNSLDVAWELLHHGRSDVIVLAGAVRPDHRSVVGHLTEIAVSELRAELFVVDVDAFDIAHGLTCQDMQESVTDRTIRRIANRVVLVAESWKYRQVAPGRVFDLSEVATLVTDGGLAEEARRAIEGLGVEVRIADREEHGNAIER